ncbi:hypothetical protein OIU84_006656 [Salix udensis]|uniref:FRIGIDA-like protein n=1 Tax=Salix udensis TaxID=889485 RepID=A0AAD6P2C7_9ROSI|nr:hypothetical protein OIU84_006656 [Salix udensis]
MVELENKKFEERFKEIELKEKHLVEQLEEAELGNKMVLEQAEGLQLKEKQVLERFKDLEIEIKNFMDKSRELELKKRQLEEPCKQLDKKRKRFADAGSTPVKFETPDDFVVKNATYANVRLLLTMDGKALQIFLNKCRKHNEKIKNEVLTALGLSSDPAELVLDAMEGFYPPPISKGDVADNGIAVKKSCNLLLEQLMALSPPIKPHDFLGSWPVMDWPLFFDACELFNDLVTVAQEKQTPEFLRVLGLVDEASRFIQILINEKQYIDAVNFIYAFELVKEFHPVLLLKDYLRNSSIAAKKRRRDKSVESLIISKEKRVADLRAVIKCIEDHKLESELSLKFLKQQIASVEMAISKNKAMLLAVGYSSKIPILNENKCSEPKSSSTASIALNTLIAASTTTPPAPPAPTTVTSSSPTTASTATPTATTTITSLSSTSASTSTSILNTSPIPAPASSVGFVPPSQTSALPSATISESLAQQHRGNKLPQPQHRGGDEHPQPQHQGGNKRPRMAFSSEVSLQASSSANPNIVHLQTSHQQPGHLFMNQGASYTNPSAGHYSSTGNQPINLQMNYNYNKVNPYYHSNTLGAPDHDNVTPFQRR